jgi:TPP-dependent indolepyruvate ferredoxin oxidoreductase alpha subunit
MKKYNFTILIILFILILVTISISSYFFYLDVIYKDKLAKKDVESIYALKRMASKPIVLYANKEKLEQKMLEYNEVIQELNIDAIAETKKDILTIRGAIGEGYSYNMFKKLLNIMKNDEVSIISVCVGKECTIDDYGFEIKIKPYSLELK